MSKLTLAQKKVLSFIRDYRAENRISPTIREISEAMGFASPVGSACHLTALRKKGMLVLAKGEKTKARATLLTRLGEESLEDSPKAVSDG